MHRDKRENRHKKQWHRRSNWIYTASHVDEIIWLQYNNSHSYWVYKWVLMRSVQIRILLFCFESSMTAHLTKLNSREEKIWNIFRHENMLQQLSKNSSAKLNHVLEHTGSETKEKSQATRIACIFRASIRRQRQCVDVCKAFQIWNWPMPCHVRVTTMLQFTEDAFMYVNLVATLPSTTLCLWHFN